MSLASAAVVSSGPNWGLIAAGATAAVAVATLLLREWQRHRSDLDAKVEQAVNAKLGTFLVSINDIQEKARANVDEMVASAKISSETLQSLVNDTEPDRRKLEELITSVAEILPDVEQLQDVMPRILLDRASKSGEPKEIAGFLTQLRDSESSTSQDLAEGGRLAIDKLAADQLALSLYAAALKRNPRNLLAEASRIRIAARIGTLDPDEASQHMTALALANAGNVGLISEIANFYLLESKDYDTLQDLLQQLYNRAEGSQIKSLLSRNLAVTLDRKGAADEDIVRAYEDALEQSSTSDLSNVARAYAAFLLRTNRFERMRQILTTALRFDPTNAVVLRSFGELQIRMGDLDAAEYYLSRSKELGSRVEQRVADNLLLQIPLLREFIRRGIFADLPRSNGAQQVLEGAPADAGEHLSTVPAPETGMD
jgi:tetratricopeptide (TPR) repeat protein